MSEHYYAKDPSVKSGPKQFETVLRGKKLQFETDSGVFSKGDVDFGSRLLVESFVLPETEGAMLDAGCGYGPIGLTIAMSYPDKKVHMIDVNERAVALCSRNAKKNSVTNVEIYASNGFSAVEERGFSAVLTNPPIRAGKEMVFSFYDGAFARLRTGGELWVVIQKKQGAPSTMKRLEELFGNVETVTKKKGYYILRSIKL